MYTILIDEAGDTGLKNVQADPSIGPTQYFCMCAAMFNESNREVIEASLSALGFCDGQIHATRLSHFEKCWFGREVSKLPVGLFGVVSNKLSLMEYMPEASKTPTHYYNKVLQYLLEKIGAALEIFNIPSSKVRIRLEARAQQYSSLL